MKLKHILASALLSLTFVSCQNSSVIKLKTPARPDDQLSMVGVACAPVETVRVGIVGLGDRGSSAVHRYKYVPWAQVTAVCDAEVDRVEAAASHMFENGLEEPAKYYGLEGYKALCESDNVDLVYVCTDWLHHVPVALYAMEHGKHVAVEVPSATTVEDCWKLVDMSEKTRRHCVVLENCCYDFFELSALEMARKGALGEVLHAEGSYHHNLVDYWDVYWSDWRLQYNSKHKGDVYPTHGLGPVAQALNINRGDRFTSVVAMETKSVNGVKAMKELRGVDCPDFQNGDLTCTLIATENGKSILVEHDVLTPRPYNRMYQLVGTKGYAAKYPVEELLISQDQLDAIGAGIQNPDPHGALPADMAKAVRAMYPNPILNEELVNTAKTVGGHGGMDWIMDYRLCYCLHYGLPVDMDVYDLASWCCVSELGAISIKNGGAPVEVPDFTRGEWEKREGFKYAFADGSYR